MGGLPAAGQSWDITGNGQLNGNYYFREVTYSTDQAGDITGGTSAYGNITFSGNGTYTISVAQVYDVSQQSVTQYSLNGTYSISASGYGFMSSPNTELSSAQVNGLVSNGIFIGSSTENGIIDFLVAAPVSSSPPNFTGTYTLSYLEFVNYSPTEAYDALVQMSPNGSGSIGTANVTYYVEDSNSPNSVNESPVTYAISNGAVALTFPSPSSGGLPLMGQQYLYISPDGNFVFGGSPADIDMFVGVRTGSPPAYQGVYYQAGLDVNEAALANSTVDFDSYYGSYYALAGGDIIGHQRIVFNSSGARGYTYSDTFPAGSHGSYTDTNSSTQYVAGNSGILIGFGIGPYLGINVALPAPNFSGSGVFVNPQRVQNSASFAPFTAGVSPREFLTLFGTNLAAAPAGPAPLPLMTTLGNVQVLMNNVPVPLQYVSPTQINLLVPAEIPATAGSIVQIQVLNGTSASNVVTEFVYNSTAGVFSDTASGLGYAAALHNADYSLVTPSSPAQPGETLAIFLTGLGAVFPSPADGAGGPSAPPLAKTTSTPTVEIGGMAGTVAFSGLAPGEVGYQIDVTVPSGLTAGDNVLEVDGADSTTVETLIPVGGSSAAPKSKIAAMPHGRARRRPL